MGTMKTIQSADNKEYKRLRSLHEKKYRDREGSYLVEGDRLVEEALAQGLAKTVVLRDDRREECGHFAEARQPITLLKEDLFRKVALTEHSQGVLAVVKKHDYDRTAFRAAATEAADGSPGGAHLLVLDGLQDPGNLGTILRTAAAAGYGGAVLLKGTTDPYAPKVVRAAAGALFRLPLYFVGARAATEEEAATEAVALLREMGKTPVGTSPEGGQPYLEADLSGAVALVIGNEGNGLSETMRRLVDRYVYIPMQHDMESLNAAVAAGILMYRSVENG